MAAVKRVASGLPTDAYENKSKTPTKTLLMLYFLFQLRLISNPEFR